MQAQAVIHVVDDDPSFRASLSRLLRAAGFHVVGYPSVADFLASNAADRPGCVVTDLRMPGMTGLQLQEALARADCPLPVVFLTAHAEVPISVRAMKEGAVDFLTKPVDTTELFAAVDRALRQDADKRTERSRVEEFRTLFEALTEREREILAHVVAGKLNKQIAYDLDIGERTVKAHRANIVSKLQVRSVADLVRFAETIGLRPVSDRAVQ